jgi:hypothetical protein
MTQEFDQFDCAVSTALREVKMFAHPDLPNGGKKVSEKVSGTFFLPSGDGAFSGWVWGCPCCPGSRSL